MVEFAEKLRGIVREQLGLAQSGTHIIRILGGGDTYAVVENLHFHPAPELFIQVSGMSHMKTVRDGVWCAPGEIMLIPPGVPHYEQVVPQEGCFRNIVVAFGRRTVSMHEAREGMERLPRIVAVEQFFSDDVGRLCACLDMIAEWRQRDQSLRGVAVQGLLMSFFGLLLDNMENLSSQQRDVPLKVVQCRRMVTEHLANPDLNVKWLAKRIVCAPDYLSHIFHEETGDKLTHYINDKRIEFACSLLENSTMNIGQVAYACGYRDPGYMTRQFQRRNGCTPRAYRKGMMPGMSTDL